MQSLLCSLLICFLFVVAIDIFARVRFTLASSTLQRCDFSPELLVGLLKLADYCSFVLAVLAGGGELDAEGRILLLQLGGQLPALGVEKS